MKARNLFLFSFYIFHFPFSISLAQPCNSLRYQQPIFDSIIKTADVVYGNAPRLTTVYINENTTVDMDLKMDIFQPYDDTLSKRPAVILAFGGGFLIGGKEDEDIQATCDSLAKRGYVTASIQYRLGMNIVSSNSGERAVYRGTQDFSAALRFIKEFADSLRIDTNYIFIGGVSAGAISALHLTFGEEVDRPASTYGWSGIIPAPDLGCMNCSGNNYQHSTRAKALINCWGAIGFTNWIELSDSTPIISFHGNFDLVVPYNCGFPFTALATLPMVCGSNAIAEQCDSIGLYNELYTFAGQGHNVWGTVVNNSFVGGPTQYFEPIINSISDFLYLFMKPKMPTISGNVTVCTNQTETYSVANTNGSTYCWSITGGTIVSQNNNSIDVLWDSIGIGELGVYEVNSFQAVGDIQIFVVEINACTGVGEFKIENSEFRVAPNPNDGIFTIKIPSQYSVLNTQISIYNVLGEQVYQSAVSDQPSMVKIDISNEPKGIYFVKIISINFVAVRKVTCH
ncbi:carboxylesterase family protein [Bacteroidales bacterium AH-315-I05]|nr:carboxylesterase family protein [Bacteroidales bacterium AH-315-I05]